MTCSSFRDVFWFGGKSMPSFLRSASFLPSGYTSVKEQWKKRDDGSPPRTDPRKDMFPAERISPPRFSPSFSTSPTGSERGRGLRGPLSPRYRYPSPSHRLGYPYNYSYPLRPFFSARETMPSRKPRYADHATEEPASPLPSQSLSASSERTTLGRPWYSPRLASRRGSAPSADVVLGSSRKSYWHQQPQQPQPPQPPQPPHQLPPL